MGTHKNLNNWKLGIDLVEETYNVTKVCTETKRYGLISQMRRCAICIPSNLSEGAARKGNNENMQFIYTVLGSLSELETQAIIAG